MDNAPNPQSGLWYCAKCTHLIHPPGAVGILVDGEHFCAACAEAAGHIQKVEAATPAMRKSRAVIVPVRPTPATGAQPRPSGRAAAAHPPVPAAPKKPFPVAIAFASGGALLLIAGVVVLVMNPSSSSQSASNSKPPKVSNTVEPLTPVNPSKPPPTKTEGGTSDPAPMVRNPVDLTKRNDPPPADPAVPVTPPTQVKVETKPEDAQQTFKNELAAAINLSNTEKYSAAMDILTRLKATHSAAPWWESQKQAWTDAEKNLQNRVAELVAEADDIRGQAAKCDKPEVLDKFEAVWRPRAAGSQSPDGWVLLDVTGMQSSSGMTLTRQSDGSVLASGGDPEKDVYTITMQTGLLGITAIRLDAMPDPSLGASGPGRHGNFVMSEFSLQAASANGGAPRTVALSKSNVDFCQRDGAFTIEQCFDANPNTGWAIGGETAKMHTAVFEISPPLSETGGTRLIAKLEFNSQWGKHILGRFRFSATTSRTPQNAAAALPSVPQTQPAADTLVAQPARGVLRAIADARARIADVAKQKRAADVSARIDAVEKLIKSKPRTTDAVFKSLEEIESLVAQDAELVEKFGERIGGARFDTLAMRDGDLALYRTTVRQLGAAAEVIFDFATPEQFNTWFWDNPANSGTAELDPKKGAVILKSTGRHNWEAKDRRGMPVLRVPFYFRPDMWMVETDVALLSDQNKGAKPDIGIMVWDGTTNVVRLSVQDSARGMHALYSSSTPKRENFAARPVPLAGKIKENLRLQMGCNGGMVNCTVTSSTGSSVTIAKEALGFEPQFVGLFIRNSDDGENSAAVFQTVKIQGAPNAERLKEIRETRRVVMSSTIKMELNKRNGALKLLGEGQLIPLSLDKAANWPSTKRMFLGANDEERFIFPNWGMQMIQAVPFVVADPKGDTVNNLIVLNSPQGKVSATMPQSVSLPVNNSAATLHLLSGVAGWGFPNGEARSVSMMVRVQYDDNQMEEHKLLNGVHFADYLRAAEVPDSKSGIILGQQQLRYIALRLARPTATIKSIDFVKGEDKTAPVIAAVTLDKRANVSSIPYSTTTSKVVAEGKVGKAMACFGKEFIDVPHAAELEPEKMTVEAWINMDQYPVGEQRRWIINKNTNEGTNGHYALMINGANVGAYMNIGGDFSAWSAGGIQLKQWQHIAFTYDGAVLKIYLNGNQLATNPINRQRTPVGTTPLTIGRRQDSYAPFTGLIDEARIYNRALPDDEIKAHFQNPAGASKEGQVGYWSFD